jgi:hypothetical protein
MEDDPSAGFRATPAQQSAIACAGAGPLGDLARQAKGGLALDAEAARCFGAGFVPDAFRSIYITPGPPFPTVTYSAACVNIPNTFQPAIKVAANDFQFFPVGARVAFATTGIPLLDNAPGPFVVTSVDKASSTFNINTDLSSVGAPVVNTGRVAALKPSSTLYSDPPPEPTHETVIPNGYEQWAADMAKEQEHEHRHRHKKENR